MDVTQKQGGREEYILKNKLINIHPYTHTFMPIHTNSTKVKGLNVECRGIANGIMTTKHVHKEREHKTEEKEREREN